MRTTDSPQTSTPPTPDAEAKRARLARLLRENGRSPASPGSAAPTPARRATDRLERRFEAQAAAQPDAVAVRSGAESLTYGELDRRADRLAGRLASLGVGRGTRVAIFVERSSALIVGLLGVLKAGATYVPLDPALPPDRLRFILADSGAPVVLSQACLADRLGGFPAHLLFLDDLDHDQASSQTPTRPAADAADDVAYVIYTSGSTGTPKGVEVTHRNVVRLLDSTQPRYQFGPADVWTMFHSFGFDFSVWEIYGALLLGGRLVVVNHETSRSPAAFRQLLATEGVTVLNQTPSAFRQLIRADEAVGDLTTAPLSLRWVIFGGEALELQSLRPWFDRHGDTRPRLVNMYGITETTVHVTAREITRADLDQQQAASPIGRAIPGWRVYLLDRVGQPVPVGVVGEMFVGGAGVARGYLNRPGLTADRFVPDSLGDDPGARLYRSGDLARRRPDGDLEYVGRADHQVKIRGFRIELGEIETTLARHLGLREAVVIVREDRAGDPRLVAYVVARQLPAPSSSELRRHLKQTLPDYMVPAVFVTLPALPLTENGKADRRALPAPGGARPDLDGAFVAPRTEVERQVAAIWEAVLDLDEVGVHDNFFDLGGHSLLATRAVSRLRDHLGVDLPLRPLFENPTVAGLAESVEAALRDGQRVTTPPLVRSGGTDPAPLASSQRALWFLDRLDPGRATFHVNAAVRVHGPLDLAALGQSFAALVERHESLRTNFAIHSGEPIQIVRPAGAEPQALTLIDLSEWPAESRESEARRRASTEARRPFDLAHDPLARCQVVRLGSSDHVILLTMHHIITDGWSFGVAARELAALYGSFVKGIARHTSPAADRDDRLRALASRLAAFGTGGGRLARVLDAATGGSNPAGLADRLPAPGDPPGTRRGRAGRAVGRVVAGDHRPRAARGDDAVHDHAGGVPDALAPARGRRRHRRRLADRQPEPRRGRGADRLLRQHAGPPRRPDGAANLPRPACPDPRNRARGVRASGLAVRPPGGSPAPRA